MRLLLDECVPRRLKFAFAASQRECITVRDAGLESKTNGELLALAEGRFDVLITIDRNIRYQQNIVGRNISILILAARSNDFSDLGPLIPAALAALESIKPGQVVEVGNAA